MPEVQLGAPTFVAFAYGNPPTTPPLSGQQQIVGGDSALSDGSDDTYVDLHQWIRSSDGFENYWDGIALPVLADIVAGDTLTITFEAGDAQFRNFRINYQPWYIATIAAGNSALAGPGVKATTTFTLNPGYPYTDQTIPAGATIYITAEAAVTSPASAYYDVDHLTRIYQIGAVAAPPVIDFNALRTRFYPRR